MPLRVLDAIFNGPAWRTFLAMGIFVGAFGLCSFNLAYLFMENFRVLSQFGAMAAFDGGIVQLIELVVWGYLSLAFYVLFKGCSEGLMRRIHSGIAPTVRD
jgi:hypothetical protein